MLGYWVVGLLELGGAGGCAPQFAANWVPQGLEKRGAMGKQYDHLWPQVASFENLLLAWRKAAKGKRSKASVASSSTIGRATCCRLRDDLRSGANQPGAYDSFQIHEPKRRLISAAPFRDRVITMPCAR